jgi:hypothetical protein
MNGEAGHAEKAENANALLENGKQHFPKLFSPLNLNGVELSNRLFFPSMGVDLGDLDGTFSSRMEEFYDGIVASGCGLVVLSNATVSPDSVLQTPGPPIEVLSWASNCSITVARQPRFTQKSRYSPPAVYLVRLPSAATLPIRPKKCHCTTLTGYAVNSFTQPGSLSGPEPALCNSRLPMDIC